MIMTDVLKKRRIERVARLGEPRLGSPCVDRGATPRCDLRQFLSERELLNLCLEAVQSLNLTSTELSRWKPGDLRPQMLMTLLTYAYATRVYGSEEIEMSLRHNPTCRYLCARRYPDARTLRRFRHLNRARLEASLAFVFENAWPMACGKDATDFEYYHWPNGRWSSLAQEAARERLQLAIITDTAFAEW
jgi:hypothetical protein